MSGDRARLLREASISLRQAGLDDPVREARLLLRWASGLSAAAFSAALAEPSPADEQARFLDGVTRRARREPFSHISGTRPFWGREFLVTGDVLDPRPETETLIAEAIRHPFRTVLDLGVGSGCILLTLLSERPAAVGLGVDLSVDALEVARRNAATLGLSARVQFQQGHWLQDVSGTFDLVVSNPPYIAEDEMDGLAPEVRDYEPAIALTPGGDGLDAYRDISARIGSVLAPGGRVVVEIGPTQAGAVSDLLRRGGLTCDAPVPDMDGRDRVIIAHR